MILLAATLIKAGASSEVKADACALFEWPITLERSWLAAKDVASYDSGSSLATYPHGGLILKLLPTSSVSFVVPPERVTPSGWSGLLFLPPPNKPGMYQITLSDNAWIDVVQDGIRSTSRGHTGNSKCSGIRKSIRFELASSPVTLQFSGATTPTLGIAIRSIRDDAAVD